MKNVGLKLLPVLLLFINSLSHIDAQSLMRAVSLEQQIENSNLLIEGEVVSKKSFKDKKNGNIYTLNTIQVHKVFKGVALATVDVVTRGGIVGLNAEVVTPSLNLKIKDVGVFMLYDNKNLSSESKLKQYKSYSRAQGFYKYNLYHDIAVGVFSKKEGISTAFYDEIMSYTKTNYTDITNYNVGKQQSKMAQAKNNLTPSAISFSPTTVSAGTRTVLTISGSGFGSVLGKVGFSEADSGGQSFIDALDTQVLTWTDTEITVEVPSGAGTGVIRVTDNSSDFAESNTMLTVSYSELNIESDALVLGTNIAYATQHVDDNGAGGYTWQMFTDFDANTLAKASFLRAFETWRCETGVNWVIGETTTINVTEPDGINIIRFDVGNELEDGVLGSCLSRYSGCFANGDTSLNWYVSELDIVFNDSPDISESVNRVETWNFGPGVSGNSEFDFESTVLHELGHGHQLGHVIDLANDVMHFASGTRDGIKDLNTDNISAALNVQNRSTSIVACNNGLMTNYGNCTLGIENDAIENNILIYPNPAKNEFFIKSGGINIDSVYIYDVSGRLVSSIDITQTSNTKTISLINVAKGMYFVNIYFEGSHLTKKLIVD